jgi:energy-converting hydrogenase Eha subunit A
MSTEHEILLDFAIQILPAPILAVSLLAAIRKLTWVPALLLTAGLALVATWVRLHFFDFAMACIGAGCTGDWTTKAYRFLYGSSLVTGILVAAILIPIVRRLRPNRSNDAASA